MRRHVGLSLAAIAVLALVGSFAPHATRSTIAAATPTPTATSTPPAGLWARFTGNVRFVGGIKPAGNATITAYSSGPTQCTTGQVQGANYGITVPPASDRPGCPAPNQTVYFKIGDYWAREEGTWQAGFPIILNLTFPKMDSVDISTGCGLYTLTFSDKTTIQTVLANLDPSDTLAAIWRWNGNAWDGYFPGGPAALNTLKTVNRLDTVWICVTGPTQLSRPSLTP